VITGYPVYSGLCQAGTPEYIAATNDDGNLYTGFANFKNLAGNPANDDRIYAIVFSTQQSFSAEFQKDTLVDGFIHP
jgi:hypothetical protein